MNFSSLQTASRLLIQAELSPAQGSRFQPTGFPDLGAATYQDPRTGNKMLLLESAQSVANRLESMVWDEANQSIVEQLEGISYVVTERDGQHWTNSILEAHRLNSPYILGDKKKPNQFFTNFKTELGLKDDSPIDFHQFAIVLAKYDINSLLHGIFLEKFAGALRIARSLSGFIEAEDVEVIISGGVKTDRIDATGKKEGKGGAAEGYGNVPYSREEYAAKKITAYFSLDLAQIRGYRLGQAIEDLLIAIALYKITKFLDTGLRLRTACDLDCVDKPTVTRPKEGFALPTLKELEAALPGLVKAAAGAFADPAVTIVTYEADDTPKPDKKAVK
jgi:CRISPR-associated protein Csb1